MPLFVFTSLALILGSTLETTCGDRHATVKLSFKYFRYYCGHAIGLNLYFITWILTVWLIKIHI